LDPLAWAMMRIASGLCVAGCYTVIEAWLQAKVNNETRGRTMGTYRVVDMTGSLAAQALVGFLEPASYVSYNLLAILCCAALLPITLTTVKQPETPSSPRLRPRLAVDRSPLAAAGVVIAALSSASFRMVGPIYGQEVGLSAAQIAWFLSAFVLGGALAQLPVGWLADKYDRRWVLIWLSVAAIGSCAITVMATGLGTQGVMLTAFLFGLTTFPIYSVAAAHAHDFATSDERVELSAALMFWFAIGAIFAPYLASVLIENYGPPALFLMISAGHLALVLFGLSRMRVRPTSIERTRYVYAPRTSFLIGRLTKRGRDNSDPS
jgi:MFS family permease